MLNKKTCIYLYKRQTYFFFGPSSFIYVFSLPIICNSTGNLILRLTLYLIALANWRAVLDIGLSGAARIVTRSRPGMTQR